MRRLPGLRPSTPEERRRHAEAVDRKEQRREMEKRARRWFARREGHSVLLFRA